MPTAFETHDVFNQPPPLPVRNLFETDPILYGAVEPAIDDEAERSLSEFGAFWGTVEARELARLVNAHPPGFRPFDQQGRRIEQVDHHPAYHALMRRSGEAGLGISPYDGDNLEEIGKAHALRAARLYMAAGTEAGHLLGWSSTLAAAVVLLAAGSRLQHWVDGVLARRYDHRALPARNKAGLTLSLAWTEKQGGVPGVDAETVAEAAGGGRYVLVGHKWYVSGPGADATLVVADTKGGPTVFLVPRLKVDETINQARLQRLKAKLGLAADACAEVDYAAAEAWIVGEEGQAPRLLSLALQSLQQDAAVMLAGIARSALVHAVHHARHRSVSGARLVDQPLVARTLADMALDVAAATALAMRVALARDRSDHDPVEDAYAKLMTPAAKYWLGKIAPAITAECLEVHGGNGYAAESDPARFHRDALGLAVSAGSGNGAVLEVAGILAEAPAAIDAVLSEVPADLGQEAALAVDVVRGGVQLVADDPGTGRVLVEQLAMLAAAAALHRFAPRAITEAYAESRLGGNWRASYGMLDGRTDARAILDYAYPS